jgi:hypothetical protein
MTPGVYALRLGSSVARLKGLSDLIYIGSAKNIQERLGCHLRPREDIMDVGWRLKRVLAGVGPLQVAWKRYDARKWAEWYESILLYRYYADHFELPPLNRHETGKKRNLAVHKVSRLYPNFSPEQILEKIMQVVATPKPPLSASRD